MTELVDKSVFVGQSGYVVLYFTSIFQPMPEWFQTRVKFLKQQDNGLIKAISEQYLVDAMSFTEAEARIQQELRQGQRDVTLVSVARSPIKEVVVYGDTDLWFKVKVTYTAQDEESEKERKVTTYLLVNANDVQEAYARTQEHLKEWLIPYQVPKVEETGIREVFQHVPGLRSGLRRLEEDELAEQDSEGTFKVPTFKPKEAAIEGKFKMPKNDDDFGELPPPVSTEEE